MFYKGKCLHNLSIYKTSVKLGQTFVHIRPIKGILYLWKTEGEEKKTKQLNTSVPESWNTSRDMFVFVCVYTMLSNGCSVSCKTIHTIGKIMVKIEV